MHSSEKKTEKAPFLSTNKPVSLTPAWESKNRPNDELNLKDAIVRDSKRIVYFIFLLHGLGTLMPWNMFITAKSYFVDFKLGTNGTTSANSNYATNFLPYVGFASQIPNVVFNWLNIFVNLGGNLTKRIVYSILVEIVIFIITVILAMLDSSEWCGTFFWLTMLTVVILNMASGIYQNTIYGMVATLPIKYTGAVVLGSNISGTFTAILSICSSYFFSSPRTAAIYYFITAMFILLMCFDTYFALPLNRFYRYHEMLKQKEKEKSLDVEHSKVPYWTIFKQCSPQLFNIFFTFFVTLAVFPAIHSDIKSLNNDFIVPFNSFTLVTCYLTFNVFAMLGNLVTSWVQWPKPKYLVIPVVLRVVFIPMFLLCNYWPKDIDRILPVLITNDWVYWIIAIIMSFSSGYLSSLGMMYAPQTVIQKYQVNAGMFSAAMLVTGIFSGVLLGFFYPTLVSSVRF